MPTMSEYLIAHGKTGAFGRFVADPPLTLDRGDRVIVETGRGLELGEVLCPANSRHAELLSTTSPGRLIRPANANDDAVQRKLRDLSQEIFDQARSMAGVLNIGIEILDVEILADGRRAVVQYLGGQPCDPELLVDALQNRHDVEVLLEDLATPRDEAGSGGCDKPDCGRSAGGGGCTTCETGGGCGSCGHGKIDMKAYFAHLRGKMEQSGRVPLA